jgi:predicted Rdx family selenoprotein
LNDEGFEASISAGTNGQFDVVTDGTLVYSKAETRRFPEPGEVLGLLRG